MFQSDDTNNYLDLSYSFRYLFDAMIGAYSYTGDYNYFYASSFLTVIHVFLSNVFLLNFLIAILSTVYNIMMDHGEFSYKSNKYEFIEKYSIAMLDTDGYAELVIHPPPVNFFTIFITPFIFSRLTMRKVAE